MKFISLAVIALIGANAIHLKDMEMDESEVAQEVQAQLGASDISGFTDASGQPIDPSIIAQA
tara:strand:- start:517 stop:702 length:186 start_codon:yes stop_codon:yes gene_type:complete